MTSDSLLPSPTRDAILDHIARTTFSSLPAEVVAATNVAIADTLACGMAGSAESKASIVRQLQMSHFGLGGGPVWGTDQLLAPIGAGVANGYQVHCLDNDCLHEAAGVATMSVILPAVFDYADRFGRVTGADFITAVNIGADVAVLLGLAATKDAYFSRTAVCGALGAAAALAKLEGFDRPTTAEYFGLVYSQLSGTQQAQTESSMAVSLQISFSVRNVLTALDMARYYLTGPVDVFDGPHGYFEVFERDGDPTPHLGTLGKVWRTTEISFRPVPSERVSHASETPMSADMSADQLRAKFMTCAAAASHPLTVEMAEHLYTRLLALHDEKEVSVLSNLAAGFDLEDAPQ
ncbi:MAG: MmgE/PrpD family protein [Rhodospirillaceae bacterium]